MSAPESAVERLVAKWFEWAAFQREIGFLDTAKTLEVCAGSLARAIEEDGGPRSTLLARP